jgi:hypothetical protein
MIGILLYLCDLRHEISLFFFGFKSLFFDVVPDELEGIAAVLESFPALALDSWQFLKGSDFLLLRRLRIRKKRILKEKLEGKSDIHLCSFSLLSLPLLLLLSLQVCLSIVEPIEGLVLISQLLLQSRLQRLTRLE